MTATPGASALIRLEQHSHREALLDAAWSAATAAIARENLQFPRRIDCDVELEEADSTTAAGNVATILHQGARSAEQQRLIGDLLVLAAARDFPSAPETETATARQLVWLEAHTPLRLLPSLITYLGDRASVLAAALLRATTSQGDGDEEPTTVPRGELLVVAAALAACPAHVVSRLKEDCPDWHRSDEVVARMLEQDSREPARAEHLEGELGPPPRGPLKTALLALSLWLFVSHGLRLFGRAVLGYKTPARAWVSERGLEIDASTQLLGRIVRSRTFLVPLDQLAVLEREVRFARAGLYAGLASLALGTYWGTGFLVDGLRAPGGSWALIGWALLFIALGALADFGLTSLGGAGKSCRLVIHPRQGRRFAVRNLDPDQVDALLGQVARLVGQPRDSEQTAPRSEQVPHSELTAPPEQRGPRSEQTAPRSEQTAHPG